jgi:SAM-dependent methyltransferase
MSIYSDYAPFYDGSGQFRFAVLMSQYLDEVLVRHPVGGRRALDLACGTGTLALTLAGAGWQVVGVDQSEEMLACARAKVANADLAARLAFVRGDLRDPWHEMFDLVTCTYDSLNYLLSEADLAACFAGVAGALVPSGLFFADMNTRYFLEHDWGTCEVLERPGFIQLAQSRFDPQTARSTMVLTGFSGDDANGYRRFDETHIERAYDTEVVSDRLAAAGLVVEAAYDCFTFQPAYDRSQRIAWVARKPIKSYEL